MKLKTWLALGLAASALAGCSADAGDAGDAEQGSLGEVSEAVAAAPIVRLNKVDARALTSVTVEVSYNIGAAKHTDWEDVGTWNRNYSLELRRSAGFVEGDGIYHGDFLHLTSTGAACTSNCTIDVAKTDGRTITNLVVKIWFVTAGAVSFDFETVAFPAEGAVKNLYVNGLVAGRAYDGSKWVGDILSSVAPPPPVIPPPHLGDPGELCKPKEICNYSWSYGCHMAPDGNKRCQMPSALLSGTGGFNQFCNPNGSCNSGLDCTPTSFGEQRCFTPSSSCGNVGQSCCTSPYVGSNPSCFPTASAPTNHCVGSSCQN